jgi:hypothetical protein
VIVAIATPDDEENTASGDVPERNRSRVRISPKLRLSYRSRRVAFWLEGEVRMLSVDAQQTETKAVVFLCYARQDRLLSR